MQYLRTELATDWKQGKDLSVHVLEKLLWFIPNANPGYEDKLHRVKEWVIEFDDDDLPQREIGLNQFGKPVLAGPSKENYGFWLDTNMKFRDFSGVEIDENEFEQLWSEADA